MDNQKSSNTGLIIIISVVVTLIVVAIIAAFWYFTSKIKKLENSAGNQTQSSQTPTPTQTATTQSSPSESPAKSAENFLKSIFDSFPGSSVDLAKANKYLSDNLKAKVKDTKESYWNLHGYIHSGPCSVSVSEVSKTDTTAVEQIITEWGKTCIGGLEEPYYQYKMSVKNGTWVIDEIVQLKPTEPGAEQVPRDF